MADKKLKDSDRFNLMLALTGLLVDGSEYEIAELEKHFQVSRTEIENAVRLISYTDLIDIYDRSPYQIDYDDLREGYVSIRFDTDDVLNEVPRLSSRQASAIAAGLVYLSSLPGLAEVGEIEQLQKIIASGITRGDSSIEIDIVPGSADADLAILREAITKGVSISCDYLNLKGETKTGRIIEPLRIETAGEYIYLRGWCTENNDVRAFRIDRMRHATILEEREISEAAKAAELIDDIYVPSENDVEVVLEVEPEAYELIFDFKPVEDPISLDQFTKQFKIKVGDVRNLGRIIARFGGSARVISPESARKAVHEFALQAISGPNSKAPRGAE